MSKETRVCPVWVGRLIASPLRKLVHNPAQILSAYVSPGMNVLEIGPGLGFFSLEMAKMVGGSGKIYCVDIQENMLANLEKRAKKRNLQTSISTILCTEKGYNIGKLRASIDFCLLFAVVHEVQDQEILFREVYHALKPGTSCLFAEPKGHVTNEGWEMSIGLAIKSGFKRIETKPIRGSFAIELNKEA